MARRIVDGGVDQRTICDSDLMKIERGDVSFPLYFDSFFNYSLEHDKDSEFKVLRVRDIYLEEFTDPKEGKYEIDRNERVRRAKEEGFIPLDIYALIALLRNQDKIPILWKEKTRDGIGTICFDGTTYHHTSWGRCNPALLFIRGNWVASQVRKDEKRNKYTYSAVVKRA